MTLRGVLDGDDALVLGDHPGEAVEEGRLPGARRRLDLAGPAHRALEDAPGTGRRSHGQPDDDHAHRRLQRVADVSGQQVRGLELVAAPAPAKGHP
ncbi:hypothetical protein [uncultured Ornithinimicrobium sp.]|uniref:hypothetical protein n=1 Tax=uncultured Ornithinimicrobium sp. TaxID=259307 RepID=UPI0025929522|nr:hypothetical protein [uncultured Ornithinimicrobium sp.]